MLRSCAAHRNPVVISVPWGPVDDMPSTDASHPGLDRISSDFSLMVTDKGAKEWPCSGHSMGFGNVPTVTELGETEDPSTIIAFGVGSIKGADGHVHGINEVSRKLCLKVVVCLKTVWGAPCKKAIGCCGRGVKWAGCDR